MQVTDKLVEKIGVQRTPGANPEMYKTDDYSAHLKGDNSVHNPDSNQETVGQREREFAGESCLPVCLFTANPGKTMSLTARCAPHAWHEASLGGHLSRAQQSKIERLQSVQFARCIVII